jgi:short subunit dehydrogenase-like uncharacterized protein
MHQRAARAAVRLMPAVGFDVVPSDCLAAMLAQKLPGATHLELAFESFGRPSRGTARTMLEALPRGGRVRIDGRIVSVPTAWKSIEVPFRNGPRRAVTAPWGDVASAWYSTGIPNVEVYLGSPRWQIAMLRMMRPLLRVLGARWVQAILRPLIDRFARGPGAKEEAAGRVSFWGRVRDAQGRSVSATLETPGGYALTVTAALAVLERVLSGAAPIGFCTPSKAFGAEFILTLPGTDFRWGDCPDFRGDEDVASETNVFAAKMGLSPSSRRENLPHPPLWGILSPPARYCIIQGVVALETHVWAIARDWP